MTTGERVLKIAIGELNTTENPPNSNNVKYNTWYYGQEVSGSAYPWCMAFVQWCYDKAGCPLPFLTASCASLLRWYKANEPLCVVSEPKPGDVIIYDFGHTGIFEYAMDDTVTAIEGNTGITNAANGGMVMRQTRSRAKVTAFIRPVKGERDMTEEGRIHGIADAPTWAQPELKRLIERGALKGRDSSDLDLSEDMLRVLIICQRLVDERLCQCAIDKPKDMEG